LNLDCFKTLLSLFVSLSLGLVFCLYLKSSCIDAVNDLLGLVSFLLPVPQEAFEGSATRFFEVRNAKPEIAFNIPNFLDEFLLIVELHLYIVGFVAVGFLVELYRLLLNLIGLPKNLVKVSLYT
jgi:hypothetical protein